MRMCPPSDRMLTKDATKIHGRPMTSTEIQQYHKRMPTKDERRAFSQWRNQNPDVDLETGEIIDKPEAAYSDGDRFMPRSWHIMQELEELLPPRVCELIGQYVAARLSEE